MRIIAASMLLVQVNGLTAQQFPADSSALAAARAALRSESGFVRVREYRNSDEMHAAVRCDTVRQAVPEWMRAVARGIAITCGLPDSLDHAYAIENSLVRGDSAFVTFRYIFPTRMHGMVNVLRTYTLLGERERWAVVAKRDVVDSRLPP